MTESTTITIPGAGWAIKRALQQFPALCAPEDACDQLASGLLGCVRERIMAAADAIVCSGVGSWASYECVEGDEPDYSDKPLGIRFCLADRTIVELVRARDYRFGLRITSPHGDEDAEDILDYALAATRELTNRGRLRCEFAWRVLARHNPILAPRRRAASAEKWAATVAHICAYIGRVRSARELTVWSAAVLLNERSGIDLPDGYEPIGYGSLRRQARDAGGIEGQALMELAKTVFALAEPYARTVSDKDWRAWSMLYPGTASLVEHVWSLIRLRRIVEAEWDLVYDPPTEEQEPVEPATATA